ncbi:Na+/H+ antiporter NhaA [Rhodospirillum rubrum]|uniref:Na(+)/H(+) antiporter NhaA n=1 Tax=Rhodospirillum rubrum (strain ATCC 11170 / ATH 1.1.1 / DSM 467 / LMG 4362 / NCIMB 8255 / S1) TaxID=269796 RepID=NHAA_RHORT|nr:Na+/H+ antiporter NhaA [Rhodospirillum rubrum]Q2RY62.1 RecName: Full=Na(+)/H(+) antiporter NhaA; AltName: Full=Sodium/proton antiporter NhaA [Rhodospirillum rubrum ATCC 11170]ABC20933.1 Na+/H+ antiporter NhaA [Rhodospirillum rubrum ATCC 11170]AEO46601.1 Na+/H+ antiporter NhaA [Rhodospirillum rubrum F11]MBK5952491.1 Na+/H+ antiporter NhaA [Rhodospirillum rubrum]QXG80631.1 Na+/H+ antiporter NhaA [Rhodospirillum rubrum]HAQ01289.1 Na+/H+ antiporter NhaA [Rhodospirillum rubrum]
MPLQAIVSFLRLDIAAGVILVGAAVLALIAANSPAAALYEQVFQTPFVIGYGPWLLEKPLLLWINDGLMAVFFLLVGLEIKREVRGGELSTPRLAALPAVAAVGGMVVPALIYASLTWGDAFALRGWAIPAATDIAFALGILTLLGPRVPISLKIFLTALAIIDDLGAILIIAFFYTASLSPLALLLAAACLALLIGLNLSGQRRLWPYLLIGVVLWVCVLKSGVHATLAGVVLALTIPLGATDDESASADKPLERLEHGLHPWVTYAILPLFAFANAGVSLAGLPPSALLAPVPLGIVLGLFLGKQIGVFGFSWLAIRSGLAPMPQGARWRDLYGVALITGVGFTMSLFIGTLAFETSDPLAADFGTEVRLGVLSGSLLSGVIGYLVLRLSRRNPATE